MGTIRSIKSNGVHNITVILDNCTDSTEDVVKAEGAGVEVYTTVDNTDKKAGALNQGIRRLLTVASDDDYFLIVDADTQLDESFMAEAKRAIDEGADCVGGVFRGGKPNGVLELCQANEYARYAREVMRKKRVMVLSGTASLIPVKACRQLVQQRGEVYLTTALTEDMEMTLALKNLGYLMASPEGCGCTTELMPTVGDLIRQRVRWYRGALENLLEYGWMDVTKRYWFQQFMLLFGCFSLGLYFVVMPISIVFYGLGMSWFWGCVTALFVLERAVTIWKRGSWKGRLLALTIFPELMYSAVLYISFIKAIVSIIRDDEHQWTHL